MSPGAVFVFYRPLIITSGEIRAEALINIMVMPKRDIFCVYLGPRLRDGSFLKLADSVKISSAANTRGNEGAGKSEAGKRATADVLGLRR